LPIPSRGGAYARGREGESCIISLAYVGIAAPSIRMYHRTSIAGSTGLYATITHLTYHHTHITHTSPHHHITITITITSRVSWAADSCGIITRSPPQPTTAHHSPPRITGRPVSHFHRTAGATALRASATHNRARLCRRIGRRRLARLRSLTIRNPTAIAMIFLLIGPLVFSGLAKIKYKLRL